MWVNCFLSVVALLLQMDHGTSTKYVAIMSTFTVKEEVQRLILQTLKWPDAHTAPLGPRARGALCKVGLELQAALYSFILPCDICNNRPFSVCAVL